MVRVEVLGLREFAREVARFDKEMAKELRELNKRSAQLVLPNARRLAPVQKLPPDRRQLNRRRRPGRLRRSVGVYASRSAAGVKAGSPKRVPYAAARMFSTRGGRVPSPFLFTALDQTQPKIEAMYRREFVALVKTFERAINA